MDYYDTRWYDPYLNRFLSPDDIIPDQYDPQSWDRYSYVRNNPVNRVDPDGHKDREDCYNCPGGAATGPKNPLPPEKQWTVEEKLQEWEKAHPEYNNSTGSKSGRPDLFRGGNPPQGDKPGDPNFSLKTQDKPYKNGDWDITVDPEGNVEPGSGGLSTRSEPKPSWKAPWEYPSDSPDPEGIRIFQDQPDTDPLHWLWEPAWKMPFEDFKQFLQNTLQNWIPFSE